MQVFLRNRVIDLLWYFSYMQMAQNGVALAHLFLIGLFGI